MTSTGQSDRDKPTRGSRRRAAADVGVPESSLPARQPAADEVEEGLQSILDDAPIIVYAYDSEGRLLFANREFERVLGVDRDALVGKTRVDFFSPEDAACTVPTTWRCWPAVAHRAWRRRCPRPTASTLTSRRSSRCATATVACTRLVVFPLTSPIVGARRRGCVTAPPALPRRRASTTSVTGSGTSRGARSTGQTRCTGSLARLRRGSLPITRGSSAGCIRTIAGWWSARSTMR